MARAIILVMDSFGIGGAADAGQFGDGGSNTLGHIAQACLAGACDRAGSRSGPLRLPNLERWGLGEAHRISVGEYPAGWVGCRPIGRFGCAAEISKGKDTPSGHWEIAGLPVEFDWGYFPRTQPCFPRPFIETLTSEFGLPGILGDKHASGTEIIAELGEEHLRSGLPICYTSADSVFQVAAHEERFGLQRLFRFCERAKELLEPFNIGRVIARPFVGKDRASFRRTEHRRDYTTPPPGETLLDRVVSSNGAVWSIGKISDIFAGRGVTEKLKAGENDGLFDRTMEAVRDAPEGALIFANFVDFDMLFGHRRDTTGYAIALEQFDQRLPELESQLLPEDLVIVTADHGCDPTWPGTDHTRENVPALFIGPRVSAAAIGKRDSFADIGQTIAGHLGLGSLRHGKACF